MHSALLPFCILKATVNCQGGVCKKCIVSYIQQAACLAALCNMRKQRLQVVRVIAGIDILGGSPQSSDSCRNQCCLVIAGSVGFPVNNRSMIWREVPWTYGGFKEYPWTLSSMKVLHVTLCHSVNLCSASGRRGTSTVPHQHKDVQPEGKGKSVQILFCYMLQVYASYRYRRDLADAAKIAGVFGRSRALKREEAERQLVSTLRSKPSCPASRGAMSMSRAACRCSQVASMRSSISEENE